MTFLQTTKKVCLAEITVPSGLSLASSCLTCRLLIQNLAGNDEPLDFARAFADGAKFYIAVELLHWIVLDEAVATVQLHCFIANLHCCFAGHQLGHRRF